MHGRPWPGMVWLAQLAFMLSLFMVAASGLIFAASELYGHGFHWADQVCNGAAMLCRDPATLGAAAAGVVAAYFILRELQA
jgi:hypothetical protein